MKIKHLFFKASPILVFAVVASLIFLGVPPIFPIILGGAFIGLYIYWIMYGAPENFSEVLKNPERLLAELQKNGPIYDHGEKIDLSLETNSNSSGEKYIKIVRGPSSKAEEIQKNLSGLNSLTKKRAVKPGKRSAKKSKR